MPISKGQEIRYCTATCKFIRCQQRALGRRFKKNNKMVVACNFAPGEICEAYKCKYSYCVKRKMATDGRCTLNLTSRRKRREDDEIFEREFQTKPLKSLKIKNKILKKIEDYDEF